MFFPDQAYREDQEPNADAARARLRAAPRAEGRRVFRRRHARPAVRQRSVQGALFTRRSD